MFQRLSSRNFTLYILEYFVPFNYVKKTCYTFLYKIHNLMEKLSHKKVIFFQLKSFVGKTIFHFHSFNKINVVTAHYTSAIFYLFFLNRLSWPNENGMAKSQFSWWPKLFNTRNIWQGISSSIIYSILLFIITEDILSCSRMKQNRKKEIRLLISVM